MSKSEFLVFAILALLFLGIGWMSNDVYRNYTNQRDYDGLFIMNQERQQAMNTANEYDTLGDWVCINVNGMDFADVVRTCQHEAAHEVFAEVIEKHPEKIVEVLEVIGK